MRSGSNTSCAALIAWALAASPGATAADSNLTVGTTVEYTSGHYGGAISTEILYIPVSAKYRAQPFTFGITIPYIRITGPGNVVGGLTPIVRNNDDESESEHSAAAGAGTAGTPSTMTRTTHSGLGDAIAAMTYTAIDGGAQGLNLDVGGRIKFATADETRNLGTGKNDYALQVDMDKPFGQFTPNAILGYRRMGDPATADFRNIWYGTAGMAYRLGSSTSLSLDFDFGQATVKTNAMARELTLGLSHKFSASSKLRVYAIKGLSDGSPDYGGGLSLYAYF